MEKGGVLFTLPFVDLTRNLPDLVLLPFTCFGWMARLLFGSAPNKTLQCQISSTSLMIRQITENFTVFHQKLRELDLMPCVL